MFSFFFYISFFFFFFFFFWDFILFFRDFIFFWDFIFLFYFFLDLIFFFFLRFNFILRFYFFWHFIYFFLRFEKKIKETDKNLSKRIYCSLSKQWLIHQQLFSYSITMKVNKKIFTRNLILMQKVLIFENVCSTLQVGFLLNNTLYYQ